MHVTDRLLGLADRYTDSSLDGGRVIVSPSRAYVTEAAMAVAEMWGVTLTHTAPRRGHHSYVFHAHDHDGVSRAVKIVPKAKGIGAEVAALREWDGIGAARLYEYSEEHAAMLIEWLHPAASLNFVRAMTAAQIIGEVVAVQARTPRGSFLSTSRYADDLLTRIEDRHDMLRAEWSLREQGQILDVAEALREPQSEVLVHADLHPRNVLRRPSGGWAAIDPAPYVGDPELGLAKIFWTHRWPRKGGPAPLHDMLTVACEPGGLDPHRAAQWAVLVGAGATLLWKLRGGHARSLAARRATAAFLELARA